jgi:hypothetical protein
LVNQTLQIMKTRFLFSHKLRLVGTLLLTTAAILCIIDFYKTGGIFFSTPMSIKFNTLSKEDWFGLIYNGILQVSMVLSLLFIGFSKEKVEDEQIAQLRLDSLQWAIYFNYALFILCIIFIYGFSFFSVLVYNVITPLIFFIIRFRWKIYSLNRSLKADVA